MTLINVVSPQMYLFDQARAQVLDWLGSNLSRGSLTVHLPDGQKRTYRAERRGPEASVQFQNLRCLRRLMTKGALGLGESYMAGEWESCDLATLIELGVWNEHDWAEVINGRMIFRVLDRVSQLTRFNSRKGSKRNIAHHYDLGNDFYSAWLDRSMTYSSALYSSREQTLGEAQTAKYARICDYLNIGPQHRVLEVGCGWGGFVEFVARRTGCHVTGITLSREQLAYGLERIKTAGLQDRVELRLQDYRDVGEQFDRIVSIEMFEAVGERYWPIYFDRLRRCLTPNGQAVLQVITIAEDRFESYRRDTDFIQKYIFPGGLLPSPNQVTAAARFGGLRVSESFFFGESYVRTLSEWTRRFKAGWSPLEELGFDDRFRRMWEFYLAYCEAGFRAGTVDVGHFLLEPN